VTNEQGSRKGHARWDVQAPIERPGEARSSFVWFARVVLYPYVRLLYAPRFEGLERLPPPAAGPYLLVANHSGGMASAEIASFAALWARAFDGARPLAGFALPIVFRVPGARTLMSGLGAIPSTYHAARSTLAAGVPILLFPGGDHESLRPFWQASRVDFAGRKGFLKIARVANVPIVPLGIRGSHLTVPILFRAKWLASVLVLPRLIGPKRWAVTLLGVIVSALLLRFVPVGLGLRLLLVYLWLGTPFVYTPILPSRIRMRIGAPISPGDLFREDDADLSRALARVESAVRSAVHAA
jgi:1-acyl-sn-glycerol-3-phosphate acyltransferase